ncbi:MAG TPA: cellobiose phosphorylase, partial [Ornithinibacter sp.]|nr:cellobiose phosphorylase [Ornithinibacter sp.]
QADARALLLRIFAAQNADGTWPQAFGFLPGDEHFRMEPSHGDVVHWPVLAVGRYLLASGDVALLEATVPWYTPTGAPSAPASTMRSHLECALASAREHFLPGTALVAYGHGDWNDSLQPVDPTMAATMTSAWTATLHHQALRTLADGLETVPGEDVLVEALRAEAAAVADDLRRHLLVDGELAGYAQLDPPDADGVVRTRRLLVHPRDAETGLRHGSLQMIHALGEDLLDPDAAAHHVALVREHLMGVDGVRLFDRPPPYSGGLMRHFQRAETATFVGREIGLMYVHAHLRWCEAMAHWGDADALWQGLQQVLPPITVAVVPGARRRQANAYPSSSDAACLDREEFAARYAEVLTGATGLEAGWRIYSSGPGVLLRIVVHSMLGVRRRAGTVEIDPVLPSGLDGLTATVPLAGGRVKVRYRVGGRGHGPSAVRLGGRDLAATRCANPYRVGALVVDLADLDAALRPDGDELEILLP